ncbi:MAG: hypothetical protein QM718_10195 [Steroidobacteraceae bacterium]
MNAPSTTPGMAVPRDHYPVGETWIFDIGVAEIEHRFVAPGQLHYHVLSGPRRGSEETVPLDVQAIRPGVFLTSWQEQDRTTVVHLEDFERGEFFSHVSFSDGRFIRHHGRMRRAA